MNPLADLCPACPLRPLGLKTRVEIVPGNGAMNTIRLARRQVLDLGDGPDRYALLRSGSLKLEYISDTGRPEVAGFLFAGDPLAATFSTRPMVVTALEESILCSLDPGLVIGRSARDGEFLHAFSRAVAAQSLLDQHRLLCARTGDVTRRLHWFLQDVAERQATPVIELGMSRDDIGHYLEARPESVSRALKELERSGVIVRERTRRIRLTA
jgi:CRP-like cAMP-binding protein